MRSTVKRMRLRIDLALSETEPERQGAVDRRRRAPLAPSASSTAGRTRPVLSAPEPTASRRLVVWGGRIG